MKVVITELKSASPLSLSKHYVVDKLEKESPDAYEKRTWRERLHYEPKTGEVFLPPMMLKNALDRAAKRLGERIPGKGKSTWTKHFESGIMVLDSAPLGIKKDEVECETLFVPADGIVGSGRRVEKCFPLIREWHATAKWYIVDEQITEGVFRSHLEECGRFTGLGRFRPATRGFYGRFTVESLQWNVGE